MIISYRTIVIQVGLLNDYISITNPMLKPHDATSLLGWGPNFMKKLVI